ncbi:MAG: sugar ABC transporter permease [Erysipelotrichaceae bacterium]|nr:sugar ABC transporter permease [Erysipelotrichaceae bacterium]
MIKTTGIIIAINKLWWLRINTKALKAMDMHSSKYPHIIKIKYHVNGKEYIKRQYIGILNNIPDVGSTIQIIYDENNPSKIKIIF